MKKGHAPLFFVVNQIRHKIGVMYGDPETTPGGNMPRFASSMTVRLYGKKELDKTVSPDMPARLHVSGVIKKFKVPIIGSSFEYDIALLPHDGLMVGQTNAWNTVSNRLKSLELLAKQGNEWLCLGRSYKTLDAMRAAYMEDVEYRSTLHKKIFDSTKLISAK